jgi:hypothetical protein
MFPQLTVAQQSRVAETVLAFAGKVLQSVGKE